MKNEILKHNDNLYEILRTLNEDEDIEVEIWRKYLNADKVFRRNTLLYFCKIIEEADIIDYYTNEEFEKEEKTRKEFEKEEALIHEAEEQARLNMQPKK